MSDFERTVTRSGIVVVDFWAAWCMPCRQFAPVFEQASQRHRDVVFAKVDTEAEPALAGALKITSTPTLMAFRDGAVLYAQSGALSAVQFDQVIGAVRRAR